MVAPLKGIAAVESPSITAYHGSPHDFERFDLSKIGTGEGAQAYGHGLYFAENEGVAKSYRDTLTSRPALQYEVLSKYDGTYDLIQHQGGFEKTIGNFKTRAEADAERSNRLPESEGRMYHVAIKAHPDEFLDWDKSINEQHPKVQAVLKKLGADEIPEVVKEHQRTWTALSDHIANNKLPLGQATEENISRTLREAGIPGIKYLDQGSRSAGTGSRNYVVFDDKLIDIMKKYGLAGVSALPAAGAYHFRTQSVDHDPFKQ
jgi:hypothetical protein